MRRSAGGLGKRLGRAYLSKVPQGACGARETAGSAAGRARRWVCSLEGAPAAGSCPTLHERVRGLFASTRQVVLLDCSGRL